MQRYGVFNAEGFPTGFYNDEEHGDNLPEGAVEITDEQLNEFIEFNGLRRWENGQVVMYTPPVQPVSWPPITRRQLRLTLVRNGIPLAAVDAAIAAMPEGLPKEEALIEWVDASTFDRNHPTLLLIAAVLNLTEAQVDAMWHEAVTA